MYIFDIAYLIEKFFFQDTQTHFANVHAAFEVLCDTAKDMKIKMPIKENNIKIKPWYESFLGIYDVVKSVDPFVIKNPTTIEEKLPLLLILTKIV